jgi:hypothetical protein
LEELKKILGDNQIHIFLSIYFLSWSKILLYIERIFFGIHIRNVIAAGRWWLTSIILGTEEAQIRRIAVQSQPGQIAHKTLPQKTSS